MSDAGTPAERRERLLRVLSLHALRPDAVQAVRATGLRLREETIRDRTERGALLDADGGAQVGIDVTGSAEQLDAAHLLQAMQPGRRYVFVHTHPEGQSFSEADGAALVAHWPRLSAVVAVGTQGVWYVLSVESGRAAPPPLDVVTAVRDLQATIAPVYRELIVAGTLARREAQRRLSHEVWERVAPDLGLRYDRV